MATPKLKAPPPTLAISKTFVYSSFDVINDHKMKEWVRSLAMELIRRLVTDRKQNRRVAKELLVILMSGKQGKELRRTYPFGTYDCQLIIRSVWNFMNEHSELKDPNGTWLISHIHLGADDFKALDEPRGSISRWLSSAERSGVLARSGETGVPVSIVSRAPPTPRPLVDLTHTPTSSWKDEVVDVDSDEGGARDADSVVPSSNTNEMVGFARQGGMTVRNRGGVKNRKADSKKTRKKETKNGIKRTKATRGLIKAAFGCRKMTEFLVPDTD